MAARILILALLFLAGCMDPPTSPQVAEERQFADRHDLEQVSGKGSPAGPANELAPLDYPIWIYWSEGKETMAFDHPEIARGVVRAAREWAALLWPTPTAPYPGDVFCTHSKWLTEAMLPAGLVVVVSLFEDEPNVGAKAGECSPNGPRYNPDTGTLPAGYIEFNENASWQGGRPLSEEDWYYVALHEFGHVFGIGTSDRWFEGIEEVWHNDSVSLSPTLDSLCTKYGRDCDWEIYHSFFTDTAVVNAISKMTSAYEGMLIPLQVGFDELDPVHWPKCVRDHAAGRFDSPSQDIMAFEGAGLRHPKLRTEANRPQITVATLAALRGFKYDDTRSGVGRYTEPTWLNRSWVRRAVVGLADGTSYAFEFEGTDCPTPVKRDRTAWHSHPGAEPHSHRDEGPVVRQRGSAVHTDYLWHPDKRR